MISNCRGKVIVYSSLKVQVNVKDHLLNPDIPSLNMTLTKEVVFF